MSHKEKESGFGSLADQLKAKLGLSEDYIPEEVETISLSNSYLSLMENKGDKVIVQIEKKGRGGKQVTIVKGFTNLNWDNNSKLESLAKEIKTKCGVGGSVKEGEIVIQGDCRDKVVKILIEEGFNAKRGN